MGYVATRTSRDDLDADFVVASGETIRVTGILVANAHASNVASVEWQTDSGTARGTIVVGPQASFFADIEFIADAGLRFDAVPTIGASVTVTVSHSAPGV